MVVYFGSFYPKRDLVQRSESNWSSTSVIRPRVCSFASPLAARDELEDRRSRRLRQGLAVPFIQPYGARTGTQGSRPSTACPPTPFQLPLPDAGHLYASRGASGFRLFEQKDSVFCRLGAAADVTLKLDVGGCCETVSSDWRLSLYLTPSSTASLFSF